MEIFTPPEVFFRDGEELTKAEAFIEKQPKPFRIQLEQAAELLSTTGRIDGFRSGLLTNGDWSIWLEDENGERHNFFLFISKFEFAAEQDKSSSPNSLQEKQLVIVDPNGPRDSVGGFHPGHWSIESFVSRMDSISQEVFMKVISEIQFGGNSKNYTINSDGSISIHINRPDLAYGIHINCIGKYV